jgi:hypothetical protein
MWYFIVTVGYFAILIIGLVFVAGARKLKARGEHVAMQNMGH